MAYGLKHESSRWILIGSIVFFVFGGITIISFLSKKYIPFFNHAGIARITVQPPVDTYFRIVNRKNLPNKISMRILKYRANPLKSYFPTYYFPSYLSTTLAPSVYPDMHTFPLGFLYYEGAQALRLGFQNVEIWLHPNVCKVSNQFKWGFYQNYSSMCSNGHPKVQSLAWLVQQPSYKNILSLPFRNILITLDSVNPQALNQQKVAWLNRQANQEEVKALYRDIYNGVIQLIRFYDYPPHRTYYLILGNELDWSLTAKSRCFPNCNNVNADPISSRNAIIWINTFVKAVHDAQQVIRPKYIRFITATEINRINTNKKSALTTVLPYVNVDMVGWSAYEFKLHSYRSSLLLKRQLDKSLDKIQQHLKPAVDSDIPQGNKRVFISEIGLAENNVSQREKKRSMNNLYTFIQESSRQHVPVINIWSLYDNTCSVGNNQVKSCLGYYLIKPDQRLSNLYNVSLKPLLFKNHYVYYSAAILWNQVPSLVRKGEHFKVSAYILNNSNLTWSPGIFMLGIKSKQDGIWGTARVPLDIRIKPGEVAKVTFSLTAPQASGRYSLDLQMLLSQALWFGRTAGQRTITVR